MTRQTLPWLGLVVVLGLFWSYTEWLHPADYFGAAHDDAIYFSSARSLAENQGYRLPSLPGSPHQTKYPVLYPWVLSWVWKLDPEFPTNIVTAARVTAALGCAFLVLTFLFLRGLNGIGQNTALLLTALCALHPFVLIVSAGILSDTLFMFLSLGAFLAAERAREKPSRNRWLWTAASLTGFAMLTRKIGIAVLLGIIAAAMAQRAYRQAIAFAVASMPFLICSGLWTFAYQQAPDPAALPGWRQTWAYYVSYGEFWKLSIPTANVLLTMLQVNLKDILTTPAMFCLFPPLGGWNFYPGIVLCLTLSVSIVCGIVRQARGEGWKPVHFALLFTTGACLLWNFPRADSYLLPFLPLFYAGLWIEGRYVMSLVRIGLRAGRPISERAVAALLATLLIMFAGLGIQEYIGGIRPALHVRAKSRQEVWPDRQEAHEWIRRHTDPATRFLANEDALLYLYTGRQAMWVMGFSNGAFYSKDPRIMEREVAEMTDVARQIGARYWIFVAGDFYQVSSSRLIMNRVAEMRAGLPMVFRSRNSKVQIYDLSCMSEAQAATCLPRQASVSISENKSRIQIATSAGQSLSSRK